MNNHYSVEDLGDQDRLHMQLITGIQEMKQDFDVNQKTKWTVGV
jgi:hypothetical protein